MITSFYIAVLRKGELMDGYKIKKKCAASTEKNSIWIKACLLSSRLSPA
jgi:hypothetical protein